MILNSRLRAPRRDVGLPSAGDLESADGTRISVIDPRAFPFRKCPERQSAAGTLTSLNSTPTHVRIAYRKRASKK